MDDDTTQNMLTRFKEQQRQVLAEKEERAPETERRKNSAEEREQHDEGKSGKGVGDKEVKRQTAEDWIRQVHGDQLVSQSTRNVNWSAEWIHPPKRSLNSRNSL